MKAILTLLIGLGTLTSVVTFAQQAQQPAAPAPAASQRDPNCPTVADDAQSRNVNGQQSEAARREQNGNNRQRAN